MLSYLRLLPQPAARTARVQQACAASAHIHLQLSLTRSVFYFGCSLSELLMHHMHTVFELDTTR